MKREGTMNHKTSHLLLYLCLIGGGVLHGQSAGANEPWAYEEKETAEPMSLRENLTQALQNYCIPKDEEGCGIARPRYQDNACYCGDPIYMYYDSVDRTCRVKCPAGQVSKIASVCPTAGYGGKLVKDF
jgi:hypothetical protein